jgi:hypothetical protein
MRLPMQKISTPLNKTDIKTKKDKLPDMEPSVATLSTILQFASAYRVQRIEKHQYIDLILN